MFAYVWFALPPNWTQSPRLGIISFALGHGFSPLLLVVLVPKIVASKYISTVLGAHKSMEQTGTTLFQTLAGALLDSRQSQGGMTYQTLLNVLVVLNVLQCSSILLLAYLQYRRNSTSERQVLAQQNSVSGDGTAALRDSPSRERLLNPEDHTRYTSYDSLRSTASRSISGIRKNRPEVTRGVFFAAACVALVVSAWILFLVTAWQKLGKNQPQH
jgi:hypothetical protein